MTLCYRGFDLGAMISNLLLSYFSQDATNGLQHAEWILEQIIILYDTFSFEFIKLWDSRCVGTGTGNGDKKTGGGELYKGDLYATKSVLTQAQVQCIDILTVFLIIVSHSSDPFLHILYVKIEEFNVS